MRKYEDYISESIKLLRQNTHSDNVDLKELSTAIDLIKKACKHNKKQYTLFPIESVINSWYNYEHRKFQIENTDDVIYIDGNGPHLTKHVRFGHNHPHDETESKSIVTPLGIIELYKGYQLKEMKNQ